MIRQVPVYNEQLGGLAETGSGARAQEGILCFHAVDSVGKSAAAQCTGPLQVVLAPGSKLWSCLRMPSVASGLP
jgi:hypothetical protein